MPRFNLLPAIGWTILALGLAHACYYQALNLENPSDYYYRYCYSGCKDLHPEDQDFGSCCTPLPAGSAPPATCGELSTKYEQAGTTCQWGGVPTADFPSDSYTYQQPAATQPENVPVTSTETAGGDGTVWVTETVSTPCVAEPSVVATSELVPNEPQIATTVESTSVTPPLPASSEWVEATSSGMLAMPASSVAPEVLPSPVAPSSVLPSPSEMPSPAPVPETSEAVVPSSVEYSEPPVVTSSDAPLTHEVPCPSSIIEDHYTLCTTSGCEQVGAGNTDGTPADYRKRTAETACNNVGSGATGDVTANRKRAEPTKAPDFVKRGSAAVYKRMGQPVTTTVTTWQSSTVWKCSGTILTGFTGLGSSYSPAAPTNTSSIKPDVIMTESYSYASGGIGAGNPSGMSADYRRRDGAQTVTQQATATTLFTSTYCAESQASTSVAQPSDVVCYCGPEYTPHTASAQVSPGPVSSAPVSAAVSSGAGGLYDHSSCQGDHCAPIGAGQTGSVTPNRRAYNHRQRRRSPLNPRTGSEGLVPCPCDCGQVVTSGMAAVSTARETSNVVVTAASSSSAAPLVESQTSSANVGAGRETAFTQDRRAAPTPVISRPRDGIVEPSAFVAPRVNKREGQPGAVTLTTTITAETCQPTGEGEQPSDDYVDCEEEEYPISSGMLAQSTSRASEEPIYSNPGPSGGVGSAEKPENYSADYR